MNQKTHLAMHYRYEGVRNRQFVSGEYYVLLYVAKGTCTFEIKEKHHFCGAEDILLLKPGQKAALHFRGGRQPLELLMLCVLPEYLKELSDQETPLEESFRFVPYETAVVHMKSEESMLIKNMILKLSHLDEEAHAYGHRLYERNLFTMVLVLTLRACIHADPVYKSRHKKTMLIDDLFLYIREHITDDLSLEQLEKEFYVSRYHICREFKKATGQTPHAYIVKARLDLCRQYIEQGHPVREVYQRGGFGGYNHFFRAFKQEYGLTPMEYYRNYTLLHH